MGWTSYSVARSPKTAEAEKAEIIRLYTSLVADAPCTAECLMASKVGSTWYVAIRLTPKPGADVDTIRRGYLPDDAGAITYAGIILTRRDRGEWGYKDMCETMGPHQAEAPQKLIALLSPLDPEIETYAGAWRDRVEAHHAARRARLKVRAGDVIEFDEPIEFSGGIRSRRFRAFEYRQWPGRRAQILYNTLDTTCVHTVRMSAKAIQQRGGRLVDEEMAQSAES